MKRLCGASVLWLIAATPLLGVDLSDKISIHGYGGWAVGASDPYPYLAGRGEGDPEVENVEASLLVSARPSEKLRIVFAPFWATQQTEGETEEVAEIELAFAEWDHSDALRFQIGRSRLPFGIYTEIYDIGTLRPLYDLPQSIYGHTGFVTEFYDGFGVGGLRPVSKGWDLTYDAYLGGAGFETDEPFESAIEAPEDEGALEGEVGESNIESLVGLRLDLASAESGLSFGVSAFAGEPEVGGDQATDEPKWGDYASFGLHFEYERADWTVRSEIGRHQEDEYDTDAGFLEASYRLNDHWQLAARYDRADADFVHELPKAAESLLRHREATIGINYWFDTNFVLRLSYHAIDGNLFAHPEGDELLEEVENESLDDRSNLILFGAQFSF